MGTSCHVWSLHVIRRMQGPVQASRGAGLRQTEVGVKGAQLSSSSRQGNFGTRVKKTYTDPCMTPDSPDSPTALLVSMSQSLRS